jgi:hypothetical protein
MALGITLQNPGSLSLVGYNPKPQHSGCASPEGYFALHPKLYPLEAFDLAVNARVNRK